MKQVTEIDLRDGRIVVMKTTSHDNTGSVHKVSMTRFTNAGEHAVASLELTEVARRELIEALT